MAFSRTNRPTPFVRWLTRLDLPEVLAIEAASFARPWEEEHLLKLLRDRNVTSMVYERHSRILGFVIYEIRARSIAVLRLAVDPQWRQTGVGTELLTKIIGKLTPDRRASAELMVSEYATPCHNFLKARGWFATKVDPDHLGDGVDYYRFVYSLEVAYMAPVHGTGDC